MSPCTEQHREICIILCAMALNKKLFLVIDHNYTDFFVGVIDIARLVVHNFLCRSSYVYGWFTKWYIMGGATLVRVFYTIECQQIFAQTLGCILLAVNRLTLFCFTLNHEIVSYYFVNSLHGIHKN